MLKVLERKLKRKARKMGLGKKRQRLTSMARSAKPAGNRKPGGRRNPVAKHAPKFNRASIHRDRAEYHRPDNNRKRNSHSSD